MSKQSKTKTEPAGGTAIAELPPSKPAPMHVQDIPIGFIYDNGTNARMASPEEHAQTRALAASMAELGLLEPIRVREASEPRPANGHKYLLVFGHRRLAAAKLLKWDHIQALVSHAGADYTAERAVENVQREDLNPIEMAIAVGELMDQATEVVRKEHGLIESDTPRADVADTIRKVAVDRVAKRVGKTAAWVRDRVFLGTLDKVTRGLVVEGRLPWEHARELAKIADPDKRAEVAQAAAIGGTGYRKREQPILLSELKAEVAKHIRSLAQVPWRLDVEFADAPACDVCPQNSKNQTGLFEDGRVQWGTSRFDHSTSTVPDAGVCLNAACYGRKSGAASRKITTACKKVTLTVNGVPKAEREKAAPAAIKGLQPDIIKPAAWTKAAKDHRDRFAGAAANKPKAASSSTPAKRAETPEAVAKRKLDEALGRWEADVLDDLNEEITRPETRALLYLLQNAKAFDGRFDLFTKPGKDTNVAIELLQACFTPTWENFQKLAKAERVQWLSVILQGPPLGTAQIVLATMGKTPKKAMPVLIDFMPKPPPAKEAKGKPAKKSKMSKASTGVATVPVHPANDPDGDE